MFKKKAQTGGLITGLVFGIASLVIGVIIAFVIVSTVLDADILGPAPTFTLTVTSEAGSINRTGYQLGTTVNVSKSNFVIVVISNVSTDTTITSPNYTVSATGLLTNASAAEWNTATVEINYTYTYTTPSGSQYQVSADALSANLTKGVDNVSSKIPTVLLVAAIVLILGVLVLLVGAWQKMSIGGGGI